MSSDRDAEADVVESELPDWVGSLSSGHGDLAERHEEITRDEVGDR